MRNYKDTSEGRRTAVKYADIINISRPASLRSKMDLTHRAKIFSPYDALRGFDEAIDKTNKKVRRVQKILLSNEQKLLLSDRLQQVKKGMTITVKYFNADPDGLGFYQTVKGTVSKIDPVCRTLEIAEASSGTTGDRFEKMLPTVIRFDDLLTIKISAAQS